jgi:glutamate/tyrosine decarboxylase-like PLP-dependent enzyme
VHGWSDDTERLARSVFEYARYRLRLDPVPLDGPRSPEDLQAAAGQTVTAGGLGGEEALRIFTEVLAPACISIDHPRYLSFIPCAPTEAATIFDLIVGASSIYGGSWLEGAGAVFAENQALRWLADLAGLPPGAGGVFVQGGTIANLSALVAARHGARERGREGDGDHSAESELEEDRAARPVGRRWAIATSTEAHSSVKTAAGVMDVRRLVVETDANGRFTGEGLEAALAENDRQADPLSVFAVVATAGTTNLGIIDDLSSIAEVTRARGIWLHVDAAYGGAGLAAPSVRGRYAGIEWADSFVVDPHKWLFAPFDCAALLYRRPALAREAHIQRAGYLDPLEATGEWNPSDYAVQLTRRARGLPFWFSLATYGTSSYTAAVERTLETARHAAHLVRARSYLSLTREPELSVVCFTRDGWAQEDYYTWSDRLWQSGTAFVTPTTVAGVTTARLAIVNPRTSEADIELILDSMS